MVSTYLKGINMSIYSPTIQLFFQLISLVIVTFIIYFQAWDDVQVDHYFQLYAPRLFFHHDHSFEGLFVFEPTSFVFILLYSVLLLLLITILASIYISITLYRKNKNNEMKDLRLHERRWNKTYTGLIMYQSILSISFLYLPISVIIITVILKLKYSSLISSICIILTSYYSIFYIIMLTFTINSFRKSIINSVKSIVFRKRVQNINQVGNTNDFSINFY